MSQLKVDVVSYTVAGEQIRAIREAVFQQEQGVDRCHDFDGRDEFSTQLLAFWEEEAVGTLRFRELDSRRAKIERLAVLSQGRGKGIASQLMQTALDLLAKEGYEEVIIHAQEYIKALHQRLGFEEIGDRFDEAGIAHVKMIKRFKKAQDRLFG